MIYLLCSPTRAWAWNLLEKLSAHAGRRHHRAPGTASRAPSPWAILSAPSLWTFPPREACARDAVLTIIVRAAALRPRTSDREASARCAPPTCQRVCGLTGRRCGYSLFWLPTASSLRSAYVSVPCWTVAKRAEHGPEHESDQHGRGSPEAPQMLPEACNY